MTRKPKIMKTETQMAYDVYCKSLGADGTSNTPPSGKEMLLGFIASMVTGVLGITAALSIAESLLTLTFFVTGWVWFSIAIWFIAAFIGCVAAIYAMGRAAEYVATGKYATDIEKLGSWAASKFNSASSYVKHRMAGEARPTVH